MKVIFIFAIVSLCYITALGQDKCFENDGLKDGHSIEMSISGKAVTGSFGVAPDFDPERVKRYDFTGTVAGSVLTVRFTGEQPDSLPMRPTAKTWTLIKWAAGEKLRVTLYGKNYNTNKWSNYTVDYKSCASPYGEAIGKAKRVSIAKGATSASMNITFTSKDQKYSYLLGLRAGQSISVSAPGCGISFFYPNKQPYEEGTAIDTWGSTSLPQTGDYVFVISPAGEPGTCAVKFTAK